MDFLAADLGAAFLAADLVEDTAISTLWRLRAGPSDSAIECERLGILFLFREEVVESAVAGGATDGG